ncbi:MAG: gliding motility-associated C-terminal domain-containing protein [Crocinitomicaceae bacterium]
MIRKIIFLLVVGLSTSGVYGQADLAINPTLSAPADGCELTSSQVITMLLVNTSGFPYSGTLEMGYSLNNGPAVTLNVTTTLPPSGVFTYSFPVADDFSACQAHDLQGWVYDAADPNNLNDTVNFTVISDCPPVVGTLSGSEGDTVCTGMNGGTIDLTGYNGIPEEWLVSTDGGTNWTSFPVAGDDFFNYTNVNTETIYKVVVGSPFGICADDTTAWFTLFMDGPSEAGVLPADFDICDNANGGAIPVTGYTGAPIDWLESSDNGATWNSTGNSNDSLWFTNLTDTTMYQFIAKTTFCPADTSAAITLTLIPGSDGGTIVGETVVCNEVNDSSLYVTGFNGDTFAWWYSLDSGATWLPTIDTDSIYEYTNLNSGTIYFAVEVTLGACPSDWSIPHVMDVLPLNLDAGPDTTIIIGDAVQLYATGGDSYSWYPSDFMDDPNSQYPTVNPDVNFTYYCQITDINDCIDTAIAIITVVPDVSTLVVPNLFTPNGDGFNDNWVIANLDGFLDNQVSIFNLYGQLIYQAGPYNNDWDGTYAGANLPDGTYYYILELNDPLYPDPIQGNVTITGNE